MQSPVPCVSELSAGTGREGTSVTGEAFLQEVAMTQKGEGGGPRAVPFPWP